MNESKRDTRRFRVRSTRCQIVKLYGKPLGEAVEKGQEVVVDAETRAFLLQKLPGGMPLAHDLGEIFQH